MSNKNSGGGGLMSSAGLMRYYDADKKAIHISPKTVMAVGAATGFVVILLNAYFGFWPIS